LRNLVGNALKYANPVRTGRPGLVTLECEDLGDRIKVTVADNGPGIPKQQIADVFKEWVQLSNPERDASKGLGLGLYIVKNLANLLGHKLEVESIFGSGSRFSIFLPSRGPIPAELLELRGATPVAESPDLTGLTVVVVEDAAGPREEICDVLMDWGCYVVAGETAEDVIAEIKAEGVPAGPHLVLADYRLRDERTGVEAIDLIRSELGHPTLPAAIWTAETDATKIQELDRLGFPVFAKPPDLERLQKLLLKHLPTAGTGHVAEGLSQASTGSEVL